MRRPFVAGNWKMNKTGADTVAFCRVFADLVADVDMVDIAVCPPFTSLEAAATAVSGTRIGVLAQAVHEAPSGAHTGEISAEMIAACGAQGTLVGHSERRAAGETDEHVSARVRAALDHGLSVIMCCGESLEQRDGGLTLPWLTEQIRSGLAQVTAQDADRVAVAYEPIWAIGTGRTATPEQAQEACAHVRTVIGERLDGGSMRVLYGGSVNDANAAELMSQPDVDGALVGGASLVPETFASIVRAAI